jgi:hypothetical protein
MKNIQELDTGTGYFERKPEYNIGKDYRNRFIIQ